MVMGGEGDVHDGEDDVGLVLDGGESYGRDHYDHEVECLNLISVRPRVAKMAIVTQFAEVARALAGARMRKGTISAGYSQVMPSQPMAKKVLKRNRKRAATMPGPLPPSLSCAGIRPVRVYCSYEERTMTARIIIENDWPAAPKSILSSSVEVSK